ncbi:MAG: fatty acid desaturase, partial [Planctomycetota bacterium]
VVEHASSFVINFRYRRRVTEQLSSRAWWLLEWACCLRAAVPVVAIAVGAAPWTQLAKLYLLAVIAITINHIRTLAAHRYRSDGRPMAHHEQFLDSTNIRGGWLTELLCPVGLRYHALHHLFPKIPYHRLGVAHRRLMQDLPAESRYRETECPSVWSALSDLGHHLSPTAQTSPSQG